MCFFVYVPATTEIYTYGHTLSLHDALPIGPRGGPGGPWRDRAGQARRPHSRAPGRRPAGGAHGLCGRRAGGLVTPTVMRRQARASRAGASTIALDSRLKAEGDGLDRKSTRLTSSH